MKQIIILIVLYKLLFGQVINNGYYKEPIPFIRTYKEIFGKEWDCEMGL
jgi:hypothetical protein